MTDDIAPSVDDAAGHRLPDGRVVDKASTDVLDRLEVRADIRRNIAGRKSVQEDRPDRIAQLLDDAAEEIRRLRAQTVPHRSIRKISVYRTDESCQRTRYYVRLTTDEGFTTEPVCWSTGSVHLDGDGNKVVVPGLDLKEARFRALHDADDWGDLLGIVPTPFTDLDGIVYKAERTMRRFTTRRILAARREAAGQPPMSEF